MRFLPTAKKRGTEHAVSPDHLGRTIRHRRPAATGALGARHRPEPRQGALEHLPGGRPQLRADGGYRAFTACERTSARRRRSRRNSHFGAEEWSLVEELIALDWSPEQVAGWLRRHELLAISYETIYVHVWRDKHGGGQLWRHMRQAGKKRRKRYGAYDSRGRLAGKRHISERPAEVEARSVVGHWEIDTVKGDDQARHSVVTLVERATGYLEVGKLVRHNAAEAARCTTQLIGRHPGRVPR